MKKEKKSRLMTLLGMRLPEGSKFVWKKRFSGGEQTEPSPSRERCLCTSASPWPPIIGGRHRGAETRASFQLTARRPDSTCTSTRQSPRSSAFGTSCSIIMRTWLGDKEHHPRFELQKTRLTDNQYPTQSSIDLGFLKPFHRVLDGHQEIKETGALSKNGSFLNETRPWKGKGEKRRSGANPIGA